MIESWKMNCPLLRRIITMKKELGRYLLSFTRKTSKTLRHLKNIPMFEHVPQVKAVTIMRYGPKSENIEIGWTQLCHQYAFMIVAVRSATKYANVVFFIVLSFHARHETDEKLNYQSNRIGVNNVHSNRPIENCSFHTFHHCNYCVQSSQNLSLYIFHCH